MKFIKNNGLVYKTFFNLIKILLFADYSFFLTIFDIYIPFLKIYFKNYNVIIRDAIAYVNGSRSTNGG